MNEQQDIESQDNFSGFFKSRDIKTIFPVPVFEFVLRDHAVINPVIKEIAEEEMEKTESGKEFLAHRKEASIQWQTHDQIYKHPKLVNFVSSCKVALNNILSESKAYYESIDITEMWINVNQKEENHHHHSHPNSYFSAVYYASGSEEKNSPTVFHDPIRLRNVIRPNFETQNPLSEGSLVPTAPTPGKLIIFPSWLEHNVPPNGLEEPRLTISFNSMFVGACGNRGFKTHCYYNLKGQQDTINV